VQLITAFAQAKVALDRPPNAPPEQYPTLTASTGRTAGVGAAVAMASATAPISENRTKRWIATLISNPGLYEEPRQRQVGIGALRSSTMPRGALDAA